MGKKTDAPEGAKKIPLAGMIVIGVCVVGVVAAFVAFMVLKAPANAAARVGDTYLEESRVTDWINTYRTNYGLTDDATFAEALKNQSATVASFRQYAIDQLITEDLIRARAKELGVEATEEEIDERLEKVKGSMDDSEGSIWKDTLEAAGLTEDDLRERYKLNILQDKVCENDVEHRDATDAETLSYVESHLAGTKQLHVQHIVFKGDDAKDRADACYKTLEAMKKAGTLNADSFAAEAAKSSDEKDAKESKAELGWTTEDVLTEEHISYLEDEGKGYLSSVISINDGERYEIVYVDDEYTFPTADDKIDSLEDLDAPADLMKSIEGYVKDEVWKSDCSKYLSTLLADAQITYYPVPDDASYNVSLS